MAVALGMILGLVFSSSKEGEAFEWGRTGHSIFTYTIATRNEFNVPPEMARVMALGSIAPDFFEFENLSAHSQTGDSAIPRVRDTFNQSLERGLSRQQAVEAARQVWFEEQRKSFRTSEDWYQFYFRAAVEAMKQGHRERAAFLLGYALHNRQDQASHRGIPNMLHAYLGTSQVHGNPDSDTRRHGEAYLVTRHVLRDFQREIGEGNWQLFCGHRVQRPGQVTGEVPEPLGRLGTGLRGWDVGSGRLPFDQNRDGATVNVLEAAINQVQGRYHLEPGQRIDESRLLKVRNVLVGLLPRQQDMLDMLQTPRGPADPPMPRLLVLSPAHHLLAIPALGHWSAAMGSSLEQIVVWELLYGGTLEKYLHGVWDYAFRQPDRYLELPAELRAILEAPANNLWPQLSREQRERDRLAREKTSPRGEAEDPQTSKGAIRDTQVFSAATESDASNAASNGLGSSFPEFHLIITGSGNSAEEVRRSPWVPPGLASAPQPRVLSVSEGSSGAKNDLPQGQNNSQGGGEKPRPLGLIQRDLSIYVVEVRERGWATDGLEKYLKPPAPAAKENVVRVQIQGRDPLAQPEVRKALDQAAQKPRVAVIIENWQQAKSDKQPSDKGAQNEKVAKVADYVARQHQKTNPQASRGLYVQGASSSALTPLLKKEAGAGRPLFTQRMVVSPLHPRATLPTGATIVVPRDTMFHNFDPGSPGYERMKSRVQELAKQHPVVVMNSGGKASSQTTRRPEMEFFPRGASQPVRLTNTRPADVLHAPPTSSGLPTTIRQHEQLHKPSKVGGVSLVTPAELSVNGRTVRRASFDGEKKQIVLMGKEGKVWRLPSMNPELVRLAYDCLYGFQTAPELSLGGNPGASIVPGKPGFWRVYYVGPIEGTVLGLILLRADELLGNLTFGNSTVPQKLGLSKFNIHTLPELFPDKYVDGPKFWENRKELRTYITPSRIALAEGNKGELEFTEVAFDIRLDPTGPAEEECAEAIVSHWKEILTIPALGAFRDLDEAARVVSVFVWLRDHGIPFDMPGLKVSPRVVYTPRDVLARRLPTLDSLRPVFPLTIYSSNGISRVYDSQGKVTRVEYQDGQLRSVQRKDGAWLRVYTDDEGQTAAIALSNGDGAAFFRQTESGAIGLADKVQLKIENDRYTGFTTNRGSRFLEDVNPEELTATIVRNFIAEGHQP